MRGGRFVNARSAKTGKVKTDDVDVAEQRIALHPDDRRLYVAGGTRQDAALEDAVVAIVQAVTDRPGMSARDLRETVAGRADQVDQARNQAIARGLIAVRPEGRAKRHYLTVSDVSDRVPDTVEPCADCSEPATTHDHDGQQRCAGCVSWSAA